MVMNNLQKAQPDIDQSESRNRAAHKPEMENMFESRPTVEQAGFEPGIAPGQPSQCETDGDAEQNKNGKKEPLHPDRSIGVPGYRRRRSRFEIRGRRLQDAGSQKFRIVGNSMISEP